MPTCFLCDGTGRVAEPPHPRLASDAALARTPLPARLRRLRIWIQESWLAVLLPPGVAMDVRALIDAVEARRDADPDEGRAGSG